MNRKHFYAIAILLLFLAAGIQPTFATTWFIGPDQKPPVIPPVTIGTWNEETRKFTLAGNTPLGDNIQIIDNGLILDGAGSKITGLGSGTGISLEDSRHVTVKNLTVKGFETGIYLHNYHLQFTQFWVGDNTIENNTISTNVTGSTGIKILASNENTVNNNTISTCDYGIQLAGSDDNTVTNNTVNSSINAGIKLHEGFQGFGMVGSHSNTLTGNTVTGVSIAGGIGIFIQHCRYNDLKSNTVSNNEYGIKLWSCNNISIGSQTTTNSISNNYWGIHVYNSNNNDLTGNNVTDNAGGIWLDTSCNENNLTDNTVLRNGPGIYLRISSNNNTLTGNTASNNDTGILLLDSSYNEIYNNNFIGNNPQAEVITTLPDPSTDNVFNHPTDDSIGGNYWSDWTTPDDNGDGFVDNPYPIYDEYENLVAQDNLPWTLRDGWLSPTNEPPVADAGLDQIVEQDSFAGASVTLDGSGSSDPDDDPLTYSWTWDGGSASGISPAVVLPLGTTTITLVVNDGTVDSEPDTVAITVEDTTPPDITCPGDVTIEAMGPDGVPVDDDRIQTFLAGAAADDDCDPSPVINHDAPTVFLPGDTVVTFTAMDASGNTSDCESTVTVVEPAEAIELIIDVLEDMVVPEDAKKEMDKAVKELNKAIDEFNNDRIDKALDKIAKAVKQLMKAQKKGASTQGVIDELVDLVQGIAEEAIDYAIETVGDDNRHVVKAWEHYDKALGNIEEGKYDRAIKEFKKAYREAMKALG